MSLSVDTLNSVKLCRTCEEVKDVSMFGKHSGRSDGLQSCCKKCKSIKDKAYHQANIDKIKVKAHNYYLNNKESIIKRVSEYRIDNKEAIASRKAEYFRQNKEKWNQYNKDRAKVDPVFALKVSMRKTLCKLMSGTYKSKRTEEIIGCSYVEFKEHIESNFEHWMSWSNRGLYNGQMYHGWDIDHVVPLSTARSVEDIIRLNHYTNLRPLCSYINRNIKRGNYEQPV